MNAQAEQAQDTPLSAEEAVIATENAELPPEQQMEIPNLADQLAEANRRADDNWDKLLRLQAEMDNLRRRTDKDLENSRKFALERFAKELLPVIDSLELGIDACAGENEEVAKLREGSELTLKQLLGVLERFNIRPIDPIGTKFNPEQHQAMSVDPSSPEEANTVVRVFQKGYALNDRLLRPALVVISQGGAATAHVDEQA